MISIPDVTCELDNNPNRTIFYSVIAKFWLADISQHDNWHTDFQLQYVRCISGRTNEFENSVGKLTASCASTTVSIYFIAPREYAGSNYNYQVGCTGMEGDCNRVIAEHGVVFDVDFLFLLTSFSTQLVAFILLERSRSEAAEHDRHAATVHPSV
ncbi:unnamed protein product [Onchocerca ochengi]|uniref:ZP domain-containing protein n=1 Tax=Onchocerca ochengi TaxID=42157 RepID=A0A182EQD6_ONCOC|nr:unnamed protein product [Onchocerca ochengi]